MSSEPPKKAPAPPVHGTAKYDEATGTLTIRRVLARRKGRNVEVVTNYGVTMLDPDPLIGSPAVRLTKPDGSSFDLIRTQFGWECSCQDWHARRQKLGTRCKHLAAVLNTGILQQLGG